MPTMRHVNKIIRATWRHPYARNSNRRGSTLYPSVEGAREGGVSDAVAGSSAGVWGDVGGGGRGDK